MFCCSHCLFYHAFNLHAYIHLHAFHPYPNPPAQKHAQETRTIRNTRGAYRSPWYNAGRRKNAANAELGWETPHAKRHRNAEHKKTHGTQGSRNCNHDMLEISLVDFPPDPSLHLNTEASSIFICFSILFCVVISIVVLLVKRKFIGHHQD